MEERKERGGKVEGRRTVRIVDRSYTRRIVVGGRLYIEI